TASVPVVTTAGAVLRAFIALDIDSVAVHTPYPTQMNERETAFIEDAGVDVVDIDGLGLRSTTAKGEVTPESVYRHARAIDQSDADAIFVSCTNYRTFEVIERLEADLEKPVVTSNQATLWNTLAIGGVDDATVALGTLFEHAIPDLNIAVETALADD
ncbi:MAG: aspartate/glutamate racemase family protein, partial [Salinirussus sp.]